ncbi:MAG TPA: UbiA family prenyltransferase [Verrucomicrobiae bacterium]
MSSFRAILVVGRLELLPTIWSNCLAGWWLGGAGHPAQLPLLFLGATLLYFGGVFLNDAFDADFDRQHHPSRPVPTGSISEETFWRIGVGLLVSGTLLLLVAGFASGALGLALVCVIVLYNAVHRVFPVAPVLQGTCRFLLYVLGASIAERGVSGWSIWCGLAVGAYVTGLGYFSGCLADTAKRRDWSLLLLVVPVGLALVMDVGRYRESGLLLSAVLILWIVRCLRQTFWSLEPSVKKTVAGLAAGIVFVDWLATCPANFVHQSNRAAQEISVAFLALFGLAILLQKLQRHP